MLSLNVKTLVTFVIFYTTSQQNVKKDLVTAEATKGLKIYERTKRQIGNYMIEIHMRCMKKRSDSTCL